MKLSGNTILITGGSSGIGLEMAREFLKRDNKVIITGRNKEKLSNAQKELPSVTCLQSDVSDSREIAVLYQKIEKDFNGLNVLINNAGIMRILNLQDNTDSPEQLCNAIDVNLKGPVNMINKFLPLLNKQSEAAIVNVSSALGFVPLPISPVYCSTKAALHSYTISLRAQLEATNIKVFELAPPATATDLLGEFKEEDMKGIAVMPLQDMVKVFIKRYAGNKLEIRPGQSNQMQFMSRYFPGLIQKQLNKTVQNL